MHSLVIETWFERVSFGLCWRSAQWYRVLMNLSNGDDGAKCVAFEMVCVVAEWKTLCVVNWRWDTIRNWIEGGGFTIKLDDSNPHSRARTHTSEHTLAHIYLFKFVQQTILKQSDSVTNCCHFSKCFSLSCFRRIVECLCFFFFSFSQTDKWLKSLTKIFGHIKGKMNKNPSIQLHHHIDDTHRQLPASQQMQKERKNRYNNKRKKRRNEKEKRARDIKNVFFEF